jgi:hypothetical protein
LMKRCQSNENCRMGRNVRAWLIMGEHGGIGARFPG